MRTILILTVIFLCLCVISVKGQDKDSSVDAIMCNGKYLTVYSTYDERTLQYWDEEKGDWAKIEDLIKSKNEQYRKKLHEQYIRYSPKTEANPLKVEWTAWLYGTDGSIQVGRREDGVLVWRKVK